MKEIYEKLLADIPDHTTFYTLEELDAHSRALAAAYPDICECFPFGKTVEGRPLQCLKVGNGAHVGLMFCCPHPNEPIGTMMIEYLSERLCADKELRESLDYTWYFVKAWDADGLKRNEAWLKGPYTVTNYSRNFFRPASFKQVDWTFPIDYKNMHFHDVLPETQAMMDLIDRIRPEFIYSLHNSGFGGVYWYMSEGFPELYPLMHEAAEKGGIPLHLGEPELPSVPVLAPAIFQLNSMKDFYDFVEKYMPGVDPAAMINFGTSSSEYARDLCGSFTLLTELPYFYSAMVGDQSLSDLRRRDAVLASMDREQEANRELREILAVSEAFLDPEDPYLLAVKDFSVDNGNAAQRALIERDPEYDRLATRAEVFDSQHGKRFYKLLQYGMLVRANEDELARMEAAGEQDETKRAALTRAFRLAEAAHRAFAADLEEHLCYQATPIRKLVRVQLACGLLVAERLKG